MGEFGWVQIVSGILGVSKVTELLLISPPPPPFHPPFFFPGEDGHQDNNTCGKSSSLFSYFGFAGLSSEIGNVKETVMRII